jgi:hypothetical protein
MTNNDKHSILLRCTLIANAKSIIIQAPGVNVIKLFTSVIFIIICTKLERLSLEKPFQPSLMFACYTGAHLWESPFRCSTLGQAPYLTRKHLTRLERPARDKHASLLRKLINYRHKKFFDIGCWSLYSTAFFFVTDEEAKTPERCSTRVGSLVSNISLGREGYIRNDINFKKSFVN